MGELTKRLQVVPPPKLYRIGEIVQYTSLSRQTVHNYTVMGLIRESSWTKGGHRLYDASVCEQLAIIEQLKRSKSLAQIKGMLADERLNNAGSQFGKIVSEPTA